MNSGKLILDLSQSEFKDLIKESIQELQHSTDEGFQKEIVLNAKEAAAYLNISAPTLHKWKREGTIPFYKKGGRVFFKKSELYNCISK